MKEEYIETIKAFAENDMNVKRTGIAMHYATNSIDYRLRKIEKETGLNPRKFYDLCELLKMA